MTLSAEHSAQESKTHTSPPQKFPVLTPIAVGLVGAIIYAIGMGTPALWGDEAASIMSAQRSWDSLWAMAGNVDAVHTAYYAFLHLWIDVFGASAFSVRVPSAIAIGVTLSGIYVLTRIFAGHRLALVASLFSLVIPRMDFMAAEARSTAFSAALATWLTILVVHLVRSKDLRLRWWILYGVGLAISIHVFLYTALIAVVHGIALLVLRAPRGVWWRWLIASAAAAIACLPFIKLANGQHGQIAFLANRDVTSPTAILVQQWFGKQPLAIAAWAAVIFAAAWAVWSWRRKRQVPTEAGRRQLVWISLAWLIVPMVLLLLANTVVGPLYTGRYLSFSAPAAGILIALALAALKPRLLAIVAGVVILVLAVPIMVTQRGVTAKGSDWSQVSEYIGAHSEAGDGVIFDESIRPSRKPRLALRLYPEGFQNTTDLGLVRPYDDTAWLWDIVEPLQVIPNVLDGVDRVWVVARSPQGMSEQENFLIQNGYTLVDTHKLKLDRIMLYSKNP